MRFAPLLLTSLLLAAAPRAWRSRVNSIAWRWITPRPPCGPERARSPSSAMRACHGRAPTSRRKAAAVAGIGTSGRERT